MERLAEGRKGGREGGPGVSKHTPGFSPHSSTPALAQPQTRPSLLPFLFCYVPFAAVEICFFQQRKVLIVQAGGDLGRTILTTTTTHTAHPPSSRERGRGGRSRGKEGGGGRGEEEEAQATWDSWHEETCFRRVQVVCCRLEGGKG